VRLALDGRVTHLDELGESGEQLGRARELLVVVDRLTAEPGARGRVADAVATAFREGDGDCTVLLASPLPAAGGGEPVERLNFTERFECPDDGTRLATPTPQLFSFNNPRGACPVCTGFGAILEY